MKPTRPYVYIIEEIDTGKRYIGSSRRKGCCPDHLFVKYFTSSNDVKEQIRLNGTESFRIVSIEEFKDPQDAINRETQLIEELDAVASNAYFNISGQGKNFHVSNHIWITDGLTDRYLLKTHQVPEGWRPGRISRPTSTRVGKRFKKMSKDGMTTSVEFKDIPKYQDMGWIIQDASNTAKESMWITNGIESRYIRNTLPIPDGWRRGRMPTKRTNTTSYKLASTKSKTVVTPHFCAVSVIAAVRIYNEEYNARISEPVFLGKNPISKKLLTDCREFCKLFGITEEHLGQNIMDLGLISIQDGLWTTCSRTDQYRPT